MTKIERRVDALKAAMKWWRSEKEASRQHLRRVSKLTNAAAILRYWIAVVATPDELREFGITEY